MIAYWIDLHPVAVRESTLADLEIFLQGQGDRPALPLRPADAPRLEDLPAHLLDLGVPGFGLSDADAAPCPSAGSGWTVYAPLDVKAYAHCHPMNVTAFGEPR
jgi:hypothetical protein